ncbi:hypothetical protein [Teredinibacter turnerae]|uniref:hypothetical protein n=1 Tax=Teredinibacter turnerae TaxID=2426 RepID=UPI0005A10B25|nr:hypothetical protein [Teredinibacter turnerae]
MLTDDETNACIAGGNGILVNAESQWIAIPLSAVVSYSGSGRLMISASGVLMSLFLPRQMGCLFFNASACVQYSDFDVIFLVGVAYMGDHLTGG